jgi:hypothetical protein
MPWNTAELKRRFDLPAIKDVIRYLETTHPSAHSDVTTELGVAAGGLPGVESYCPNASAYAYDLLHTAEGVVFALAVGMKALVFRLPTASLDAARAEGGEQRSGLAAGWVCFDPFRADQPRELCRGRMRRRARLAHAYARTV